MAKEILAYAVGVHILPPSGHNKSSFLINDNLANNFWKLQSP
jgi:hypothetical protein